MKWIASAFLCSLVSVHGGIQSSKHQPPPFDADLFRKCEQVFSVHGEFLYWRVQEGALDYALKMQEAPWGPTQNYAQGKFQTATFNGDPGFRIGASFFRAPHYWEVKAQYTRLTANGSNHAVKPSPVTLYLTGTWPQISSTARLLKATSHIHMNYNVADLWATRVFNTNHHLRLRMIGGGTAAWITQDWKVRYYNSDSETTTIRNRWGYAGGGLRVGTMIDWYWTWDLYLTGLATTAAYLGCYHNRALQKTTTQLDAGYDTSIPVRNTDYRDVRAVFNVQVLLGPSWQKNFKNCRAEVFVGYEAGAWFNLQEVYRSTAGAPRDAKETWINTGLIAVQGLTTRVTVDF